MTRPPAKHGLGARPPVKGAPSGAERSSPFAEAPVGPPPTDARGAAGRGLRRPGIAAGAAGPGGAPQPSSPGAPAPFASYGPDAAQMAGEVEGARARSLGVLAIVGGLVFMVASTLVLVVVVLLMMLWWTGRQNRGDLAANQDGEQHIRDTGYADPTRSVRQGPGPRAPGDPGERTVGDGNVIPPGPATVVAPAEMMFLSIEINCPSGFRNRGRFKKISDGMMSATVPNVPGDESCTVTFQGSEPAKTYITGNQKKICQFNPTECYLTN